MSASSFAQIGTTFTFFPESPRISLSSSSQASIISSATFAAYTNFLFVKR